MSGLLMRGTRYRTRSGLGLAQDAFQPSTVKGPRPVCCACVAPQSAKLAALEAPVSIVRRLVDATKFLILMFSLRPRKHGNSEVPGQFEMPGWTNRGRSRDAIPDSPRTRSTSASV